MKRLSFIISALVILAGAAACQQEISVQEECFADLTITASIGTKVTYNETDTALEQVWEVGDRFFGFMDGDVYRNVAFEVAKVDEGTATLRYLSNLSPYGKKFHLIYCPAADIDDLHNGVLNFDLSEQAADKVPAIMLSSATEADGTLNFNFRNVCSIIGVKDAELEKAGALKLTDFTITGKNLLGESALNGKGTIALAEDGELAITKKDTVSAITKAVELTTVNNIADTTVYFAVLDCQMDSVFLWANGQDFCDTLLSKTIESPKYYVLASPKLAKIVTTTGTAKAKLDGTNEVDVTWVQLWEDGPKWATINVGVTDTSATGTAAYGGLYRWGGTNNMRSNTSAGDDHYTGNAVLSGTDDTATKIWGSAWRMPTLAELNQLRNYTKDGSSALATALTEWTAVSGGVEITGKGDYASNSIFLPTAGMFDSGNSVVSYSGSWGDYWSSSPYGTNNACRMNFNSPSNKGIGYDGRKFGESVRPVLNENPGAVIGITLDQTSATIFTGYPQTLTATVSPSDATNKTLSWSSSNTAVATVDANGVVSGVAAGTAVITAAATDGSGETAICTVKVYQLPEGAIPGFFSVSDTKKVFFSKGNLYYNGSTGTYHFEDSQTAYPTSWDPNHVGHFYYSKTASIAYAQSYSDNNRATWDMFFTNSDRKTPNNSFTVEGQTGVWRILDNHDSYDWIYLLNSRGSGNKVHRSGVEVAGNHNCLVIAPDGNTVDIKSSYTAEEWTAAESAYGFVCLPAAGWRSGSSFTNQDSLGGYLASSPVGNQAHQMYYVSFGSSVNDCAVGSRSYALSVRLVMDVTE